MCSMKCCHEVREPRAAHGLSPTTTSILRWRRLLDPVQIVAPPRWVLYAYPAGPKASSDGKRDGRPQARVKTKASDCSLDAIRCPCLLKRGAAATATVASSSSAPSLDVWTHGGACFPTSLKITQFSTPCNLSDYAWLTGYVQFLCFSFSASTVSNYSLLLFIHHCYCHLRQQFESF